MDVKKADNASSKPQRKTGIESGEGVLDAEQYQRIRRSCAEPSGIIDADGLQAARSGIRPRVCEEVKSA
ncbi:MAG TPA: hypothetical protein O0X27_04830 [Methanocorpusculum sp.]|nr:hypothetical protein [Methanocorpusculum sp.]